MMSVQTLNTYFKSPINWPVKPIAMVSAGVCVATLIATIILAGQGKSFLNAGGLVCITMLGSSLAISWITGVRWFFDEKNKEADVARLYKSGPLPLQDERSYPYDAHTILQVETGFAKLCEAHEVRKSFLPLSRNVMTMVAEYCGVLEGDYLSRICDLDKATVVKSWEVRFCKPLAELENDFTRLALLTKWAPHQFSRADDFAKVSHPLSRVLGWETLPIDNKTRIVELACNLYMLSFEDHQDDPYLRGKSQEFYSGLSTALRLVYHSHEIFSGSLIPLTKRHLIHRLGLINDLRLTQMVLKNIPNLVANAEEAHRNIPWHNFRYVGFSGSEEMMVMFIESYKTEKWQDLISSFAFLGWVNALRAIVKQDGYPLYRLRHSIFDLIDGARRKKNPGIRNFNGESSDFEQIFVPDRMGQRIANGEGNHGETFKFWLDLLSLDRLAMEKPRGAS